MVGGGNACISTSCISSSESGTTSIEGERLVFRGFCGDERGGDSVGASAGLAGAQLALRGNGIRFFSVAGVCGLGAGSDTRPLVRLFGLDSESSTSDDETLRLFSSAE